MSDKNEFDNNNPEEEFDFLDDDDIIEEDESFSEDAVARASQSTASGATAGSIDKTKVGIAVLVVAGLSFGGYYFLTKSKDKGFTAVSQNSEQVAPVQQPQPAQNDLSLQELQQQQAQAQQKEEAYDLGQIKTELFEELLESTKQESNAPLINDLQTAIRRLDRDVSSNVNQIRSVQYTLKEISDAINSINSNIRKLDRKLNEVNGAIDNVNQDVSGVKKVIADEDLDITTQKAIDNTIKYVEPEYTVYAVVSGRAWLKTKSGSMVYVVEGDKLGKYGTVSNIDVVNHIVSTSSGTSFR